MLEIASLITVAGAAQFASRFTSSEAPSRVILHWAGAKTIGDLELASADRFFVRSCQRCSVCFLKALGSHSVEAVNRHNDMRGFPICRDKNWSAIGSSHCAAWMAVILTARHLTCWHGELVQEFDSRNLR
jgi:hypothetical protein